MIIVSLVIGGLAVMTLIMTASWMFQKKVGNAGWTDVFWTLGTGACGVAISLWPDPAAYGPRQWLVAAIVGIWSLRLGLYVAARVAASDHEDPRYVAMRKEHGDKFQSVMFRLTFAQPPVSALLLIAVALAAHQPTPWLRLADFTGAAILAVAILGEAISDNQMKRFRADPSNKGKVMDKGLWGWSRHPNYFFEWLGWVAYPVMAINLNLPSTWASLIAPVIMYQVLNKLTGVPPTEAAMVRSRGDAYRQYQKRVSPFFPLPPKKKSNP
jgi:steroid 5-alpha reductase family enzyme